jgi:hypothetical protein
MKKITLLAGFGAIVFTLSGPATVLAADPTGSESESPEAIAPIYVVDRVATSGGEIIWSVDLTYTPAYIR